MKITKKQIESVLALPGPKKYAHFIKVAADQGKVWGLYSNGWAMANTNDGQLALPLWPAKEYAERCIYGLWSDCVAREIELDSFFEDVIPSLRESGTMIGVFYTPDQKGVLPSFEQLESDLRTELDRLE